MCHVKIVNKNICISSIKIGINNNYINFIASIMLIYVGAIDTLYIFKLDNIKILIEFLIYGNEENVVIDNLTVGLIKFFSGLSLLIYSL